MKNIKRILGAVLAMVMLLSVMLTGCGVPKIAFNKIPDTAATYGDGQELTTGQYLAYLYLEFENMYYNQGLYQYEAYGMDPWAQSFPYGEGDEKLLFSDYIIRATQDNIKRQIVLTQMMKDNGLSWMEEDLKDINDSLATMEKDAYLPLGFNNDSYAYALKNANLNERSTFYGLYGEGGKRAVSEDDLKKYFEDNYLSYKIISIALTDKDNQELGEDSEERNKIMDRLKGYLEIYEEEGFEAALETYEKDESGDDETEDTTTETEDATTETEDTTTDAEDTTTSETEEEEEEEVDENRVDNDATTMDEELVTAIRSVDVGTAKIVEYKAGGTTPTAALIVRMDIHEPETLYDDSVESIIYELKYEEFDKEVDDALAKLTIVFDEKVVAKCKPEDFLEIINNL